MRCAQESGLGTGSLRPLSFRSELLVMKLPGNVQVVQEEVEGLRLALQSESTRAVDSESGRLLTCAKQLRSESRATGMRHWEAGC